jgi:ATP-dependent RNA helicase DDX5/DBP2
MQSAAAEAEAKAARKAARKQARKAARKEARGDDASQPCPKRARTAESDASASASARAYLAANEIVIHEEGAPPPCLELRSAPFPAPLVRVLLAQKGFLAPSAVQASTWPIAVTGRDVLAIAKTGSGKTLGFLLPVLARCHRERAAGEAGAPIALIMAPTRELALQIHAEALKFGGSVGCRPVAVYGGASKERQVSALSRGCEIVVGTPGRVKEVLRDGACRASRMSALVLDEADRMLDMGFERDIRSIVWSAFGERERQTLLYSATWPEFGSEIQTVAGDMLRNPVKVTVGAGGERLTANASVTQRVHVVDGSRRMEKFSELIAPFRRGGADAGRRVIVFANMKATVKKLANSCRALGLACDEMSGDRSQSQREATIRKFKAGQVTVVVATDVAARGLDIKGIERVINYELPADDFQDYVHRIGRTGRAGTTGESDSLFTAGDKVHSQALIKLMKDAGQDVPPELARFAPQKIRFD